MQSFSIGSPDTEYIPRDDESEAERIQNFNLSTEGVGAPIYYTDEDVKQYSLEDFGLNP